MLINISTGLVAFGIFALALENFEVAVISFGIAGWLIS